MVARVGLISAKFDGTMVDVESRAEISALQFVKSSGVQMTTAMPEEEQDITEYKVKST